MRITDLELYRWKWHNEVYLQFKRVQAAKNQMRPSQYWKEHGAFVSVLPRQTGKSTMIKTMIDIIQSGPEPHENCIVICPTSTMAHNFTSWTNTVMNHVLDINLWESVTSLGKSNYQSHLFVDEFEFIDCSKLNNLLSYPDWISVNMVSTLR